MIQLLRGNSSTLNASQQIFAEGQPVFEKDTQKLKIGNGVDIYSALKYIGESSGSSGQDEAVYYKGDNSSWYYHDEFWFDINSNVRLSIRVFTNEDMGGSGYNLGTTYEILKINMNNRFTSLKSNIIGFWGNIASTPNSTWISSVYKSNLGVSVKFKSDYLSLSQLQDAAGDFLLHVLSCDTLIAS